MNSSSFPSATLTSTATSLSRNGLIETPFGYSQFLKFPSLKKHPLAKNLKLVDFRAPASGILQLLSYISSNYHGFAMCMFFLFGEMGIFWLDEPMRSIATELVVIII